MVIILLEKLIVYIFSTFQEVMMPTLVCSCDIDVRCPPVPCNETMNVIAAEFAGLMTT